jgi:hypothetical protein
LWPSPRSATPYCGLDQIIDLFKRAWRERRQRPTPSAADAEAQGSTDDADLTSQG